MTQQALSYPPTDDEREICALEVYAHSKPLSLERREELRRAVEAAVVRVVKQRSWSDSRVYDVQVYVDPAE